MTWFTRLRSWVTDSNNNIGIRADYHDSEDNNFATGINQCLNIGGLNSPTSNISWGNNLINALGAGVAATDAANISQVQTNAVGYAADTGSTNVYAIALSPALASYAVGQSFKFQAGTTNTGACTLNINSLGAKSLKKDYNTDPASGDIVNGQMVTVIYDGTNFQIQNEAHGLISQSTSQIYGADAGSSDTYSISLTPALSTYATGQTINFKANTANSANSGASTLNVNALGSKSIKKDVSTALAPYDIGAGQIVQVGYDGTNFQMLSPLYGTVTQTGSSIYAADSGSTNAYAVTLSPVPGAYVNGMTVRFKAASANTGTCTLNVNSLGAITIKKYNSSNLASGDIANGQLVEVSYDGTNFQMLSPIANTGTGTVSSVATGAGLSGGTITTSGTLTVASGVCLQVQTTTLTGQVSTSSVSFVDLTGLSVTITPNHNTSTILILVGLGAVASSTTGNSIMYQLKRGSTTIGVGSAVGSATQCTASMLGINSSSNAATSTYMSYVDSPATTSATTYKLQWLTTSGTAYTNTSNTTSSSGDPSAISTITVIEIY